MAHQTQDDTATARASELAGADEATRALAQRIGHTHLRQRLYLQVDHVARVFERTRLLQRIQDGRIHGTLHYALKLTGLYEPGRRNAARILTRHNLARLTDLPEAFDGFRILHLSDLHLDIDSTIEQAIARAVENAEFDLCVVTGDLRNHTHGDFREALRAMKRLVARLGAPAYAVLGNHDFIEFVPPLQAAGLRFLLNESVGIERHGERVFLSGVDDPYFYAAHDLFKAREGVPDNAVSILLSHSPSIYRTASACGWDFMLAGHTHGGQICLPGGVAIVRPGYCPRWLLRGPWRYGHMIGYTSAGAGSCAVPVRFFCPPEIVVHTLKTGACRPTGGARAETGRPR